MKKRGLQLPENNTIDKAGKALYNCNIQASDYLK
jgi:hypothetical protein